MSDKSSTYKKILNKLIAEHRKEADEYDRVRAEADKYDIEDSVKDWMRKHGSGSSVSDEEMVRFADKLIKANNKYAELVSKSIELRGSKLAKSLRMYNLDKLIKAMKSSDEGNE